jgi:hypothetical protein
LFNLLLGRQATQQRRPDKRRLLDGGHNISICSRIRQNLDRRRIRQNLAPPRSPRPNSATRKLPPWPPQGAGRFYPYSLPAGARFSTGRAAPRSLDGHHRPWPHGCQR